MGSSTWLGVAGAIVVAGCSAGSASAPAALPANPAAPLDCTPVDGLAPHLACTGLYADWASKTLAPESRAYAPAVSLWADGATKSRWIQLPPGSQIDTSDLDDWTFPLGTKIWKEFQLGGQRIETRMLSKTDAGWTFAVYRWSADETSAPLLLMGEQGVNGTSYEVPPINDCPVCHNGRKDKVLGFELLGLGQAAAEGLNLATLAREGLLTNPPPSTTFALPEDGTGKAAPALAWLHANCGNACHNGNSTALASFTGLHMKVLASQLMPGSGAAPTVADLDTFRTAVNVPAHIQLQGQPCRRIAAGDSANSLLPHMDMARGGAAGVPQMPPLGTNVPDVAGVQLVKDWIDAL
jgi:hypothetical protein